MIQGLVVLNNPSYSYERWHGTLIFYAIMLLSAVFNTVLASRLPLIERATLVIHIIGFFAVLIPLVVLAPHGTAHDVFAQFLNGGGFKTQGISFFVGVTGSVFSFIGTYILEMLVSNGLLTPQGADGAVHMCEEIKGASTFVPRSMMSSIAINGILGIAMLLATLFCIGNVDDALQTPTKFPFIEIFAQGVKSNGGATGMLIIIEFMIIFATITFVTATSRMTWAFARDQGLPGSNFLSKVTKTLTVSSYITSIRLTVTPGRSPI